MSKRFNHSTDVKLVGRRIMQARKDRGLTLKDVSRHVGVHYTQISRIERGHAALLSKNMQKICIFLDISDVVIFPADGSIDLPQKVETLIRKWPACEELLLSILDGVEAAFKLRESQN